MSSPSNAEPALHRALQHAIAHLNEVDSRPVGATVTAAELRERLGRPLSPQGDDPARVIDELVADVAGGLLGSAGGRFFAWVIGGSLPAALAADWLTSAWDQNAVLYACSPAEAVIEEVCGRWLKELLGLPEAAGFALTTGCQMAHLTCLAAARNALLARRGWDVEARGLCSAPPIHVLVNGERHGSIERALRLLGLGTDCIVPLPTDDEGRVSAAGLRGALDRLEGGAAIVVLCAGDINMGAFDDFETIVPIAHAHGAWVHVDGAFGLWVRAAESLRDRARGVEAADSWATDGHKWLNVPYDAGYAFVADPDAHRRSMSLRASYLTHAEGARDPMDWTPEWSRRGRGVATYAALRQLGRRGIADLVERCCRHAAALVEGIGALRGAEIVWSPRINQGLVRFWDPRPGATRDDHDAYTDEIIARVNASGHAFFGGTTCHGIRCMRVSVCSHRTDDGDVRLAVAAVREALDAGPR